jgi:hypothetical protein
LKHFSMHQGFEIEQRMFELIARVAPKCEHLPHMVKVHVETRSMLILPLASRSWADAELSTALTWEVLQAACVVLPLIHSHGFVHGDISPYNILVGNANGKVFINDFSCSLPIGTVLRVFCGTLDFASDALGVLLLGDSSRPYTYLPLDDHKSLFFSVLSRYWPSSSPASSCKPHLPWSNEPIKANLLQVKALCVLNHRHMLFTDELRTHVGDTMFAFLQRWFELLFRNDGTFSTCSLIVDHLKSFVHVVGSVVASDKPSQAVGTSTRSIGHVFPPSIRPKSAALRSSCMVRACFVVVVGMSYPVYSASYQHTLPEQYLR